ncbi:MAG: hypothetical protein VX705_07050 [Verrucomicrobiota bacterium]|nr:hypothetical protein [Verrucomicrobiota bacterium]|tara:strand:+ start:635 stop:835 length:201 start_codon:yes stop_codon:yes gene_type:complete
MNRACHIALTLAFALLQGCAWMNPFRSKTPDELPTEPPPPYVLEKKGSGQFRATVDKNATKAPEKD